MKLRYKDAIRLISHTTTQTLISVSASLGHQPNWVSLKLGVENLRLNNAIRIAEAMGYELVLHPASEPLGDHDIAIERSDAE